LHGQIFTALHLSNFWLAHVTKGEALWFLTIQQSSSQWHETHLENYALLVPQVATRSLPPLEPMSTGTDKVERIRTSSLLMKRMVRIAESPVSLNQMNIDHKFKRTGVFNCLVTNPVLWHINWLGCWPSSSDGDNCVGNQCGHICHRCDHLLKRCVVRLCIAFSAVRHVYPDGYHRMSSQPAGGGA